MAPYVNSESASALSSLVGQPITRAIVDLVKENPLIERVAFVAYRPAPGLDARLTRSVDPNIEIRNEAAQLREQYGIPFWDSILAISMKRGQIPERYVDLAILHDRAPDEHCVHTLSKDLSQEWIEATAAGIPNGFALAFSSHVALRDGTEAHIPMMDFRCNPSPQNSLIVKKALTAMGEHSGVLINSGRSYHFYGLRLLSQQEWVRFLAMGILFSPVVDVRYIAHRLADGACRLRVSLGPDKPTLPHVGEVFW